LRRGAARVVVALLAFCAFMLLACGGALALPLGAFTQFRVPTTGGTPIGIAAGPDGAMWFTELNGNKIGRITATGSITEFPIPTANSQPLGIAAGPDGALWFTEFIGNKIGRITPTGSITEFPIPTPGSLRGGIAAGPGGDLWFTESNAIGRITPTGSMTEFPLPTTGSQPQKIAAGPDGDMWFTDSQRIGRITPTGSITEFPIPTAGSQPYGIVAGPEGAMWFTEGGANRIGLIGTGPPAAKITSAKISSRQGAATFSFKAIGFATGFQCALVRQRKHHKQPKPHFSSCKSPKTYEHLTPGKYAFEIRALSAAIHGTPAGKSFNIS
jgi:streptogramin lyase